jgi:hypothetical protein
MARPSAKNKLSDSEISDLREIVTKGIETHGNSRKFAAAADISASTISLALHGRLVVKSRKSDVLLKFKFSDSPDHESGAPREDRHSADRLPDDLLAEVDRLTGGTRIGHRRLIKMLKSVKALQSA